MMNTGNSRNEKVEIYIPSELGYEKIAISAAAVVAQKMGFSPDRIEDLKTAIGEAVANAIEHGNQLKVEIRVLVVLSVQERSLALQVVDQGQQPIPDIPVERVEREDNRGWGMFLIKNLVDEVEVFAQPGRNEIRMVIHLER
jgi:serine/threonine-protein kinase RsbW